MRGLLTKRTKGPNQVQSLNNLTLAQIYPRVSGDTNLNCCGDPDCGNYGIEPASTKHSFVGRGGREKRLRAAMSDASISKGVGRYKIGPEKGDSIHRETTAFEFSGDPRAWADGRRLTCQHQRGNSECGVRGRLLSNEAYEEELNRLRTQNGIFEGPICGNCGTGYLEAPDEFIFNGANGTPSGKVGRKIGSKTRARSVRVIHKPCRGLLGARFTVSSEHRRQKKRDDNIRILAMIVNGSSLHDMRRLLRTPRGETEPGMSRLYDRIFWLEKVLLTYERAQLAEWRVKVDRKRVKDGKPYTHTWIAHDDISISVNWETRLDRRLTQLNCSISADIRSGYVFRCDVDFDPTIDPLSVIEETYCGPSKSASLRKQYRNAKGTFTAPLMHFQRPTARFDEPALFAAAISKLDQFVAQTDKAFDAAKLNLTVEAQQEKNDAIRRAHEIEHLRDNWFNFVKQERDSRNSFQGIMTRDTYTKAASLACLKDMVPPGKITIIGEQEGTMGRVMPHIFREEILADRFEWMIVAFDKEASSDLIKIRKEDFRLNFHAWRAAYPHLEYWEALQQWTSTKIRPAVLSVRGGQEQPWPGSNFKTAALPRLWLRSPVPRANEIDKVVGFPLLSLRYRAAYRQLDFNEDILDPQLRAAIARRMTMATLQPVSTFQNALRYRVSIVERAGGVSSRKGSKYINGSAYNPRVLIAMLNIWRIYYNFFDWREYSSPDEEECESDTTGKAGADNVVGTVKTRNQKVPGKETSISLPVKPKTRTRRTTPAMRMGVHTAQYSKNGRGQAKIGTAAAVAGDTNFQELAEPILETNKDTASKKKLDRRRDDRPLLPNLAKILYQPWIFHGTPMWAKLQGR